MKVVYLNAAGQMGGAEWSLLTLLGGLLEQPDFTACVVIPEDGPLADHCRQLGIATEILPFPKALETIGDSRHGRTWRGTMSSVAAVAGTVKPTCEYLVSLRRLLRRECPDAIHTNGFKMHLAGACARYGVRRLRSTPLVAHVHDYVSSRPLAGIGLKVVASQFSRFIANSLSVAEDLRRFLRTDRVEAVYNAFDANRFSPEGAILDLDAQCGLPQAASGTVRVGLVASFGRWKGHVTFLQALAKLDRQLPVRAYVIGGPIYRTSGSQYSIEELWCEARRLNVTDRVGFTGFLSDSAPAVRALDIVVHASTQPEPFGMVIVEAMACRKAVIVSSLGGAQELFEENRTAMGHRPGDADQLAEKIQLLAKDPSRRAALGREACLAVNCRFRQSDMASSFRRTYDSVVKAPLFEGQPVPSC